MFSARMAGLALISAAVLFALPAAAETYKSEKANFEVETVAEGLENPWGLAFLLMGECS